MKIKRTIISPITVAIMSKNNGYTIIEVIVSVMVMALVFSIILPGFYMTHLIAEKGLIDRHQTSIQRHLNLFFRKQIYESDCIYIQDGNVYLKDLEPPSNPLIEKYYNVYSVKNDLLMRHKYKEFFNDGKIVKLDLIPSGGTSQFEKGIQTFSIELMDENHLLVSYQLAGDENRHEMLIEHGKKVIKIP